MDINLASGVVVEAAKAAIRGTKPLLGVVQDLASPRDALFAESLYGKFMEFIYDSGIRDGRIKNGYEMRPDLERLLKRITDICANIAKILAYYAPEAVEIESKSSEETLLLRERVEHAIGAAADGRVRDPGILDRLGDPKSWTAVVARAGDCALAARFKLSGDSERLRENLQELDEMLNMLLWNSPKVTNMYLIEQHRNMCLDQLGVDGLRQLMKNVDKEFAKIVGRRCIKHLNNGVDTDLVPRNIRDAALPWDYLELDEADATRILVEGNLSVPRRHWISAVKNLPQTDTEALKPANRSSYYLAQAEAVPVLAEAASWPSASTTRFWSRLAVLCYAHSGAFHTESDGLPVVIGRHKRSINSSTQQSLIVYRIPQLPAPKSAGQKLAFDTLSQLFATTVAKPDLDARVALASSLFMFVYRYHQMGWLHKQLRPENVILFRYEDDDPGADLSHLLIVGLGYTRQSGAVAESCYSESVSAEKVDQLDYIHPRYDAAGRGGRERYCEEFDLFALGVMLFQIFLWAWDNGGAGSGRSFRKFLRLDQRECEEQRVRAFKSISRRNGRSIASIVTACIWGVYENPRTWEIIRISSGVMAFEMAILSEMERVCRGYNI